MVGTERFIDSREQWTDFLEEILVRCPSCSGCARVLPRNPAEVSAFAPRRMVCGACGLIRDHEGQAVAVREGVDAYFGAPLWLTTRCCGETLWAYNARHLDLLESFVAAGLREQERHPEHGWSNRSLANRLPAWIKAGKNRPELLRALQQLRERLP